MMQSSHVKSVLAAASVATLGSLAGAMVAQAAPPRASAAAPTSQPASSDISTVAAPTALDPVTVDLDAIQPSYSPPPRSGFAPAPPGAILPPP